MTEMTAGSAIGFVGLGNMGAPMAAALVAAGHRVRGFDVSPAARQTLAGHGGIDAPALGDAVRGADTVILMLPDSDAVESVVHDGQFEEAARPGAVVVDMSSSDPLRTRILAARLAERGGSLVDAPVSGGVARARARTLTIMAGGDQANLDRVDPVLRTMGTVLRAGPVGCGHAVKALNNLLSASHLLATGEAMLAGERFGLDPAVMLSIINASSGRSGSTENKWPNFILPATYDSGFGLRLMLKDMRIATDLAERVGVPHQLGTCAVALWDEAARQLPTTADHTEVAGWLRRLADDLERARPDQGRHHQSDVEGTAP